MLRVFIGAAALLAISQAIPCSLSARPYQDLQPQDHVFYGEIVGHVALPQPLCDRFKRCIEPWGYRVAVLKSVHLPRSDQREIDVYAFGLGADCSRIPSTAESVKRGPVGTRLKVVGRPLAAAGPSSAAHVALDASRWADGLLITMPAGTDVEALHEAKADYSIWFERRGEPGLAFELRKDLARLRQSTSPEMRGEVLGRLAAYHWAGFETFFTIVSKYMSDRELARRLVERHETTRFFANHLTDPLKFLRQRAARGEAEFQFHLARFIRREDVKGTVEWLNRASANGYVAADLELADLYDWWSQKEGTDAAAKAKYAELARVWYEHAARNALRLAKQGDPGAHLVLAELYYPGRGGLPEDYDASHRHFCLGIKNRPRGYPTWWLYRKDIDEARCVRLLK